MQVKIKKEGKQKTYNLISSWNDVTLEKWAILINKTNKSKSGEALNTIKALSDIPTNLINELSINYIQNGVENNLENLMSVLYRPIVEKEGKHYSIKAYDTTTTRIRAEKFKKMKARDVNSSLIFFWTFVKELAIILPLYLMELSEKVIDNLHQNNLVKNGTGLA